MASEMRKTGIDGVGDIVAWGTHFCLFYETKEDLLDTLVSYCKTGLESGEYCLWFVAEPLTIEEATGALKHALPDTDRYLADSQLEILSWHDWFFQGATFDGKSVTDAFYEKLARVSAKGYAGARVTGDAAWFTKRNWTHFCEIEEGIEEFVADQRLVVLCTFPLSTCRAFEILDAVRTHQFALAKRHGRWDVIESAALKRAKAEIKALNDELEQKVVERTEQLMRASDALREAQAELAHVNRVTTMGELSASITHEVMQPIAAVLTNAEAALSWLNTEPPDLRETRQALDRIVRDVNRAVDIIGRIRALIKKVPPRKDALEINHALLEVMALTRGEAMKNGISVQTQLAENLPLVHGDRVQMQQVMLNLIVNAIEEMSAVSQGSRELLIGTRRDASGGVLVAVRDSGPGLNPDSFDRLFEAFYTTKPGGMGMGLPICRSIIEAHGGRIWASSTSGRGTTFEFTLPTSPN